MAESLADADGHLGGDGCLFIEDARESYARDADMRCEGSHAHGQLDEDVLYDSAGMRWVVHVKSQMLFG